MSDTILTREQVEEFRRDAATSRFSLEDDLHETVVEWDECNRFLDSHLALHDALDVMKSERWEPEYELEREHRCEACNLIIDPGESFFAILDGFSRVLRARCWRRECHPYVATVSTPRMRAAAGLPNVVCLCGSTRFMDAFHEANRRRSLVGEIVLTVEIVTYDGATDPQRADPDQKRRLDDLHLRKIDLADEVLILNVGGYVGESTRAELEYARQHGKHVTWLERSGDIAAGEWLEGAP